MSCEQKQSKFKCFNFHKEQINKNVLTVITLKPNKNYPKHLKYLFLDEFKLLSNIPIANRLAACCLLLIINNNVLLIAF